MRRALLSLLLVACAHSTPPPAAPAGPRIAPRPFSLDQIRDATTVGLETRFRVEAAGSPPQIMIWRVTASDSKGFTFETEMTAEDGAPLGEKFSQTATWSEVVNHAAFPADRTVRSEGTYVIPAGKFDSIDYVVKGDGGEVKTFHFAKSWPGPPIEMIVEKDGVVAHRMTILSRVKK